MTLVLAFFDTITFSRIIGIRIPSHAHNFEWFDYTQLTILILFYLEENDLKILLFLLVIRISTKNMTFR